VLRSEAMRSIWCTAEHCDNAAFLSACSEVCCPALSDVPSYSALRWLANRRPQAEGQFSHGFSSTKGRRGVYTICRRKLTILFALAWAPRTSPPRPAQSCLMRHSRFDCHTAIIVDFGNFAGHAENCFKCASLTGVL